ncbi:MAG: ABC transporter substrate-binding protein, partial [Phycisphaerales bacterium]
MTPTPRSPLSAALAAVAVAFRGALLVAAVALVAWSFWRVGTRELGTLVAGESDAEVELVVMHWSGDGGPEEDAIVEEALARFEAEHPGIRVRRVNPGDAGSFYTKLQTMLVAGEPPDVFYVGAERLANFAELGLLAPLDEFVAAEGSGEGDGSLDLDDFFPATVEAFRYDGSRVGDGTLYGIPKDFTTVGFYLNLELFKRAGIDPPRDDWTWEEFIEIARRLGEVPDATGAEFVTWPFVVRTYLWTEGVDVIGEDFDDLRFDDPQVGGALERRRAWRHDEANTLTSGRSRV